MTATQLMTNEMTSASVGDVQRDSHRLRQSRELAIETLVKETHVDAAQVGTLYDAAHEQLISQAKIKTYISVIATRLVKVKLQGDSQP